MGGGRRPPPYRRTVTVKDVAGMLVGFLAPRWFCAARGGMRRPSSRPVNDSPPHRGVPECFEVILCAHGSALPACALRRRPRVAGGASVLSNHARSTHPDAEGALSTRKPDFSLCRT